MRNEGYGGGGAGERGEYLKLDFDWSIHLGSLIDALNRNTVKKKKKWNRQFQC